jgi:thiol-disulfide isomerase/thioredoxin
MKNVLLIGILFWMVPALGQGGYQPGNVIGNLTFTNVLNAPYSSASFNQVKGKLTFLDFFGTWCVPCVRGLPTLMKLQEKNKGIKVVLISTEEEKALRSFLAKRPNLPFPVVVDERETITAMFLPPSLPYTVVVDEAGKVLSLTEASEIDDAKIAAWLSGRSHEMSAPELPINKRTTQTQTTTFMKSSNSSVALSQDFIYAAKIGEGAQAFVEKLKGLDYEMLKSSLQTDAEKKAFWINLYNGYTQYFLRQNPEQYRNRNQFFRKKQITVAGKEFSLDDIEHGILRRSKIKWGLGHLNNPFPGKTEKELRVDTADYRLHFALNCGAKSCPPIAFYAPEQLEQQLELAAKSYLTSEVELKESENTVYLPAIMGWFRGDFGGKKGMRELLRKQGYTNLNASTKIRFKDYDWNIYLDNYKNL